MARARSTRPGAALQSVEYVGERECQCIAVEAESRLYVTDDFIVTHNTSAAIILDSVLRGRRRALWVSENRNLMRDAVRDWTALGGPADVVFDLGACKGPIQHTEGICFASYDTLKGKPRERDGRESGIDRLEQVVAWLAGRGEESGFEGVVVFDESHNMASALDRQGGRGIQKASQRALVVIESAKPAPERPVVYASATGATEVANLAYAARLGLWGRGTPFPSVEAFVEKVSRRWHRSDGEARGEGPQVDGALPRAVGLLRRRGLPAARPRPGGCTRLDLRPLRPGVAGRLAATSRAPSKSRRPTSAAAHGLQAYSQFWGAHQRFFLHVLVAMSAPSLIRDMETRLAVGESCVVQLVSTMEAATERAYAKAVKRRR